MAFALGLGLVALGWFSLCFFSEGPGLRRGTKHRLEKKPRKNSPKDRQSGVHEAVKPNSQFPTAGLLSIFWDFTSTGLVRSYWRATDPSTLLSRLAVPAGGCRSSGRALVLLAVLLALVLRGFWVSFSFPSTRAPGIPLDVLGLWFPASESIESAGLSVVNVVTDQMVGVRRSTIPEGEIAYHFCQPSPFGPADRFRSS